MSRNAVLVLLLSIVPAFSAVASDAITIASVELTLGQSIQEVQRSLPSALRLAWVRDEMPGKPTAVKSESGVTYESTVVKDGRSVVIIYSDDHGEHAYVAATAEPQSRLAFLVFENGTLTRVTRIVGAEDYRKTSPTALVEAIAATLDGWKRAGVGPVTVETTYVNEGNVVLKEVVFSSGSKTLTLLELPGGMQLVENLGRGDRESVSFEQSRP